MFKVLMLQAPHNLSDEHVEYLMRDRLVDPLGGSTMRFLGLGLEDAVPDAKAVWLYREALTKTGVIEALFDDFDAYLKQRGYLAMGGQIIDRWAGRSSTQRWCRCRGTMTPKRRTK